MSDEFYGRLDISQPRRWFGVGSLLLLGFLLTYVGTVYPGSMQARIILALVVVGIVWSAWRMWHETKGYLVFSDIGLVDDQGKILVAMDNIVRVDRSLFAFKPTNGFIVISKVKQPLAWKPGLWWCVGHRVGIGGVTHAGQAKLLADIISLHLANESENGGG
ncbi:MAG: hypothetical protein OXE94_06890 [Aestuariivita sp.]|nr:hypothetical protein [Aestuariivita sp.]MCY4202390.1 hypothetical protein [Aestuariivita sp.]MCY4288671.1 hypothetical protein [Aestuariivita sp.]MCY4345558.1 hypothetical protein [Aestuariivita sp.]